MSNDVDNKNIDNDNSDTTSKNNIDNRYDILYDTEPYNDTRKPINKYRIDIELKDHEKDIIANFDKVEYWRNHGKVRVPEGVWNRNKLLVYTCLAMVGLLCMLAKWSLDSTSDTVNAKVCKVVNDSSVNVKSRGKTRSIKEVYVDYSYKDNDYKEIYIGKYNTSLNVGDKVTVKINKNFPQSMYKEIKILRVGIWIFIVFGFMACNALRLRFYPEMKFEKKLKKW